MYVSKVISLKFDSQSGVDKVQPTSLLSNIAKGFWGILSTGEEQPTDPYTIVKFKLGQNNIKAIFCEKDRIFTDI